jgi:hypothetical protein
MYCALHYLIKKRAAFKDAARKRENIAGSHSAPNVAHVTIGLTGIGVPERLRADGLVVVLTVSDRAHSHLYTPQHFYRQFTRNRVHDEIPQRGMHITCLFCASMSRDEQLAQLAFGQNQ